MRLVHPYIRQKWAQQMFLWLYEHTRNNKSGSARCEALGNVTGGGRRRYDVGEFDCFMATT
jgi:hypothetical protein